MFDVMTSVGIRILVRFLKLKIMEGFGDGVVKDLVSISPSPSPYGYPIGFSK